MNAYRRYMALTAVVASAAIYALWHGVVGWGIQKFPDIPTQIVVAGVAVVFIYAYTVLGHRAALLASRNESSLMLFDSNAVVNGASESFDLLKKAATLRNKGVGVNQRDFSLLYELTHEELEGELKAPIESIDAARIFLFFAGLTFTVIGIVQGFASQGIPSNPEEAKIYSFTIIKALGLAYLPTATCIGTSLVLYVLSYQLQQDIGRVLRRFDAILYRVAILGEQELVGLKRLAGSEERRVTHAQST